MGSPRDERFGRETVNKEGDIVEKRMNVCL